MIILSRRLYDVYSYDSIFHHNHYDLDIRILCFKGIIFLMANYSVVIPDELYRKITKEISSELYDELIKLPSSCVELVNFVKSQENRINLINFIQKENDTNKIPSR